MLFGAQEQLESGKDSCFADDARGGSFSIRRNSSLLAVARVFIGISLIAFLGFSLHKQSVATELETGGSSFITYMVRDPNGPKQYIPNREEIDKWTLCNYEENPTLVENELIQMCANGQRKIALTLWFASDPWIKLPPYNGCGLGMVGSSDAVAAQTIQDNIKSVVSRIGSTKQPSGQACFNELQFRFAPVASTTALDKSWTKPTDYSTNPDAKAKYDANYASNYASNKNFIINIRTLIENNAPSTLKRYYDLGQEEGGRFSEGAIVSYQPDLWRDYVTAYGTADTYGFSVAPYGDRVTQLLKIYNDSGAWPSQIALDVYNLNDFRDALVQLQDQLTAYGRGRSTMPVLIQETFYNDPSFIAELFRIAAENEVPIRTVMQWPLDQQSFGMSTTENPIMASEEYPMLYANTIPATADPCTGLECGWVNPSRPLAYDLMYLDINGDDRVDLVQAWNFGNQLYVMPYLASGSGFEQQGWINTGQGYASASNGTPGFLVLDIDGNGKMDLVQQWNNNGTLWLLPYLSTGSSFVPQSWTNTQQGYATVSNGTPGLLVLDVDGNGKMDLVQQWNNAGTLWLEPLFSTGTGFVPGAWTSTGQGYASASDGTPGLLVLDVDGNGKMDLVQQWNNNGTLWLLPYLSTGSTFAPQSWINTQQGYAMASGGTPGLLALDVDGNGKMDLVQQWNNNGTLWLLPYLSTGSTFIPQSWTNTQQGYATASNGTPGLLVLDVDGNGKMDLVQQWNSAGTLWLEPLFSTGTGFTPGAWTNTGQGYTPGIWAAKYNGDSIVDLVQPWNNRGTLWLEPLLSTGGGFQAGGWTKTGLMAK